MIIAIKTVLFLNGLYFTIRFLIDFFVRLIAASKISDEKFHEDFVHGYIMNIDWGRALLMIICWTAFYFINLLA